jgi:hypothetical protein
VQPGKGPAFSDRRGSPYSGRGVARRRTLARMDTGDAGNS